MNKNVLCVFKKNMWFYIAPIFVILAQIPFYKDELISKILSFVGLFFLIINFLFKDKKINIREIIPIIFLFLLISIYIFISVLLYGNSYFSDTFYNILISVIIFIFSYLNYDSRANKIDFDLLIKIMIFTILFLSITIFIYLNQQGFTFFGRYYYYGASKNLVGFLVAFGCILSFSMLEKEKYPCKLLYLVIFLFCFYVDLMLKSRTSLVCLFIGLFLSIFFYFKSIRSKLIFFILLMLVLFTIMFNDYLYDLFVINIFAAGRNLNDFNDMTSGRLLGFYESFELWLSKPFFGAGDNYIDNNVLMWLSEHGLFGFILIFILMVLMLSKVFFVKDIKYRSLLIIIAIMMLLNGLMESYAPFGPGTKFFCCWLLISGYNNKRETNESFKESEMRINAI